MNKLLIHDFGKLKLDRDGVWYHDDQAFVHQRMSNLFSRSIIKVNDEYFVKIGKSQVPIQVEDVVVWVLDLDFEIDSIKLYLSNDTEYTLDKDSKLFISEDNQLYFYVDDERVKFSKNSYNQITKRLECRLDKYYISFPNIEIPIFKL